MISEAQGFSPISAANARILILGSMPGQQSLEKQEYYGNQRNSFWRIAQSLFEAKEFTSYQQKIGILVQHRVALWDVISACNRVGSLDSNIESNSIVINDFDTFFCDHPQIEAVYFNGARAEVEFRKRVLPAMNRDYAGIRYQRLLSTSPANARYSFDQKLANWQAILDVANDCTENVPDCAKDREN